MTSVPWRRRLAGRGSASRTSPTATSRAASITAFHVLGTKRQRRGVQARKARTPAVQQVGTVPANEPPDLMSGGLACPGHEIQHCACAARTARSRRRPRRRRDASPERLVQAATSRGCRLARTVQAARRSPASFLLLTVLYELGADLAVTINAEPLHGFAADRTHAITWPACVFRVQRIRATKRDACASATRALVRAVE